MRLKWMEIHNLQTNRLLIWSCKDWMGKAVVIYWIHCEACQEEFSYMRELLTEEIITSISLNSFSVSCFWVKNFKELNSAFEFQLHRLEWIFCLRDSVDSWKEAKSECLAGTQTIKTVFEWRFALDSSVADEGRIFSVAGNKRNFFFCSRTFQECFCLLQLLSMDLNSFANKILICGS